MIIDYKNWDREKATIYENGSPFLLEYRLEQVQRK